MATPLLSLHDLVIHIPEREAGEPLDLGVHPGQCWGILGPNGVGKTTLLHTLAGLRAPRRGSVRLAGTRLAELGRQAVARRMALVFQDHHDGFPATVLETALIGRHPYLRAWDVESPEDLAIAREALARVDLAHLEQRLIATLSGGERQRLAIATALTQTPELYLLDEPTNHLDLHHQSRVLALIHEEVARGGAAVLSLHDVNLAARHCDHLLLLYPDGQACWGPTERMLVPEALERLYGQRLARGQVGGVPVFIPH
ncbi:ABC transporter ATP-binding protein [Alkalilimnicola ehrlichii]|uniref:ABC transporter ATP-binding protein n=1 Tax=Alkalilimnicola ehrlichii TaxID=351052 RepID=UPI003BA0E73B